MKRKRIPIFFSLVTLFSFSLSLSLCSFFHCYYYYYYYCRFSCVACSHLFSSLSSLTKSQGGEAVSDFDYRLFFFFLFFLSLLLLLLEFVSFQQRERERGVEKNRCRKEQGCDNTYSISIFPNGNKSKHQFTEHH